MICVLIAFVDLAHPPVASASLFGDTLKLVGAAVGGVVKTVPAVVSATVNTAAFAAKCADGVNGVASDVAVSATGRIAGSAAQGTAGQIVSGERGALHFATGPVISAGRIASGQATVSDLLSVPVDIAKAGFKGPDISSAFAIKNPHCARVF